MTAAAYREYCKLIERGVSVRGQQLRPVTAAAADDGGGDGVGGADNDDEDVDDDDKCAGCAFRIFFRYSLKVFH